MQRRCLWAASHWDSSVRGRGISYSLAKVYTKCNDSAKKVMDMMHGDQIYGTSLTRSSNSFTTATKWLME